MAVTRAGEVYSWGEGGCGQLGIGRVTVQDRPVQVMACDPDDGSPFEEVACGLAHVLARSANGNVWVWGLNVKGQLGLGDTTSRFTPTLLEEQDLSQSTDHAAKAKAATEIGSASGVAFRQLGGARERAPVPSLGTAGGGKEQDGESKRAPLGKRPQTPLDNALLMMTVGVTIYLACFVVIENISKLITGPATTEQQLDNEPILFWLSGVLGACIMLPLFAALAAGGEDGGHYDISTSSARRR